MKKIYAVCTTLNAGYEHDKFMMRESGIKVGNKIELIDARVDRYHTDIYLNGYDGWFNSVFFDFVDENDEPYDIYNEERYKKYF